MDRSQSKYFHTAVKMDQALLRLLETKDFAFITVKEICQTAGVNRSTFYLHYENTRELLEESVRYMLDTFDSYFIREFRPDPALLETCPRESLFLVTPSYLTAYLTYIHENRGVFQVALKHAVTLNLEQVYQRMFCHVFDPILSRLQYPVSWRHYIMIFFLTGINAVVTEWLRQDCTTPMEEIAAVIMECCGGLPPAHPQT